MTDPSDLTKADGSPVHSDLANDQVPGARLDAPSGAAHSIGSPDGTTSGVTPSYGFLFVVAAVSTGADIGTKLWAEKRLSGYPGTIELIKNYLAFTLAKNRGGAWGLLQGANENIRRPFFLLVSVAAIIFIMTLYRKLQPGQTALRWGLPLVLGGALGNVFDRVRYGFVIDFIDAHVVLRGVDHHWPTFNVADIAICVGVGLMALDVFLTKKVAKSA